MLNVKGKADPSEFGILDIPNSIWENKLYDDRLRLLPQKKRKKKPSLHLLYRLQLGGLYNPNPSNGVRQAPTEKVESVTVIWVFNSAKSA